jgi:DNA helicase II / ATP-dependent DNA helicase PcrA
MDTTLILSPQQIAALDWIKTGKGSLILNAYAGTGKTSTLMEMAKVIKGQGFMGAFNKAIAEEFKEKLKRQGSYHVKGSTLHAAGMGAWTRTLPGTVDIAARKVDQIAREYVKGSEWASKLMPENQRKLAGVIKEAVGFGKQACLGVAYPGVPEIGDKKAWEGIIEHFDLDEDIPSVVEREQFIWACEVVYRESLDLCEKVIDFDDMLLAPLYFKSPFQKYDWVFIDECQDTNMARRLIAFEMMRESSRMVAVGDRFQAIYGFAGANADSMDLIETEMKKRGEFTELPLSVTYRCPKNVVKLAREWVPKFEAYSENPMGLVTRMHHQDFFEQRFNWDDAILCRNTRPLVGIAERLREQGVACIVEGGSGRGLRNLAQKWGEEIPIETFLERLDAYEASEVAKWESKGKLDKVEYVQDKCATLRDMCQPLVGNGLTMAKVVRKIDLLFGENNQNVLRLCTIHRSKGREWKRVYLIGRNRYMPSPYAVKEHELQSERNLAYVAVTRAKVELVEVDVPFQQKRREQNWWEK